MTGVLYASVRPKLQGTSSVKSPRSPAAVFAPFDEPNLIAHVGLVRSAERCDLPRPVSAKVEQAGAKNGAGSAAEFVVAEPEHFISSELQVPLPSGS